MDIFEAGPYVVRVAEDKKAYEVYNKDTEVVEVTDSILGKCLNFAETGAEFLDAFNKAKEERDAGIEIFSPHSLGDITH